MSAKAVADLLECWDMCGNPIFMSAAGQMRQAMRAEDPRSLHCSQCGRAGLRGFSKAVDGLGDYLCENVEACDRRVDRLLASA